MSDKAKFSETDMCRMLYDIGHNLLNATNADEVVKKNLEYVGRRFSFDRILLNRNLADAETGRLRLYSYLEWVSDSSHSIITGKDLQPLFYDSFPMLYTRLKSGEPLFAHVKDLESESKEFFQSFNIKTLICIPILFGGEFWGVISFHNCTDEKELSETEKYTIASLALTLSSFVIRQDIMKTLEFNEQRLYKALENSGEGVWDFDFITNKIYISESGRKIIGIYDHPDYQGASISLDKMFQLHAEEDLLVVKLFMETLAKTDEPVVSDYFRMPIDSGIRSFSVRGATIERDEAGNPLRAVGTFLDVTDTQLMENRLKDALVAAEKANRAKSSFLATMSHEIRTPLNGMMGFLRLLVEHVPEGTGQEYLRIINNSTGTLLNIINSILDISKVESGSMLLDHTDCNLSDELEAIARLFSATAYEKRINLHTFIDSQIPTIVKCDQQRIRQIISNLLNNALKFTPTGGFLYLNATVERKEGNEVSICFSIRDTGIGIAGDYKKDIFKPFTQADNTVSRKYGGSGLGLTIAYKFVELMGGELKIDSELGKGSDFYFTLNMQIVEDCPELAPLTDYKLAYLQYPKSDLDCDKSLRSVGCEIVSFDSFDELLDTDFSGFYGAIFSVFYTNQNILNDIQTLKNKYSHLPVLLITYPVDVSIFDVLNSLKIKTKIRPISSRKLHGIIQTLKTTDTVVEEEHEADKQIEFTGKVLVAEDNIVNSKLISIMLNKYGVETTMAVNGKEALDKMKDDVYDIILMDVNMPVMDGMTATREIRRQETLTGFRRVPIIALTANVLKEDAKEFLAAGMDFVLTKPIISKELEEVFKKYLQQN